MSCIVTINEKGLITGYICDINNEGICIKIDRHKAKFFESSVDAFNWFKNIKHIFKEDNKYAFCEFNINHVTPF